MTGAAEAAVQAPERMTAGRAREFLRAIGASRTGLFGAIVVAAVATMAVLAPWIAPYAPAEVDILNRLQPPSAAHWMGTDFAGRDVLSRVIWGARPSLQVGLPDPQRVMRAYPHELSGGMRQRALIGMALACEPRLLIADEPTTALDVTVQAQIVELFHDLRARLDLTLIYITHNLDLMAELCDRAIVMYAGRIVEESGIEALFAEPRHPYTRMLIDCVPRLDEATDRDLVEIRGMPPPIGTLERGCPFEPRCPVSEDRCRERFPIEHSLNGHRTACWQAAS